MGDRWYKLELENIMGILALQIYLNQTDNKVIP
jgi:hypothetical protein